MSFIADRLNRISPSQTMAITGKAARSAWCGTFSARMAWVPGARMAIALAPAEPMGPRQIAELKEGYRAAIAMA